MELSLNVPVAVNCCGSPIVMRGDVGPTTIDVKVGCGAEPDGDDGHALSDMTPAESARTVIQRTMR